MNNVPENQQQNHEPMDAATRMRKLIEVSENTTVTNGVPIDRYYSSLVHMHTMAEGYIKDLEPEKALILLLRFIHLSVRQLPSHKEYVSYRNENRTFVESALMGTITTAEDLKAQLKEAYELDYEKAMHRLESQKEELKKMETERMKRLLDEQARQEHARAAMQVRLRNQQKVINNVAFSSKTSTFDATSPVAIKKIQLDDFYMDDLEKGLANSDHIQADMIIAGDLVQKFLDSVVGNTNMDIETCGVLCGRMVKGKYVVTHAILPPQTGTANSCMSIGEMEVFGAQNDLGLLTFGWIHTHPSQTAFLSSVDLHTHHAYQSAMAQAIAIVCAPSHKEVKTFSLTPNGMQTIGACQYRGFHPHAETLTGQIFGEASHVSFCDSIQGFIVDLRVPAGDATRL